MLNDNEIETMRIRSQAHARSPEHLDLFRNRPGQLQLAEDWIAVAGERKPNGGYKDRVYAVRPTGGGKTISIIDHMIGINRDPRNFKRKAGDKPRMLWDKRCLFLAPTNVLVHQWAGEMGLADYRDESKPNLFKYVIEEEIKDKKTNEMVPLVGVYDASQPKKARDAALTRQIVGMTYDSFRLAVEEGRLDPEQFSVIYCDEIHSRPRGPRTRQTIQEEVMNSDETPLTPEEAAKRARESEETMEFIRKAVSGGQDARYGKAYVYGVTATDLYKSNKTIADYLELDSQPFHRTTLHEAIDAGENCGYRNIVVYPTFDLKKARYAGDDEDGAKKQRAVLEQEACDEAALRILRYGRAPRSGRAYRDMKSAMICANVDHAIRMEKAINAMFGEGFARTVSGRDSRATIKRLLDEHHLPLDGGGHQMLNSAVLLMLGWDNKEVELLFMNRPRFHSPIEMIQGPGRSMRTWEALPDKESQIINFMPRAKGESITPNAGLIFGHLAGGFFHPSKGYEYPENYPPRGPGGGGEYLWPDEIKDLDVHYTTEQLVRLQEQYNESRARDEYAKKRLGMMTAEEMAKKANMDVRALKRYVFDRLRTEYECRQTRQKEVVLRASEDEEIYLHTQRFPVSSMGYFNVGGHAVFCLSEKAIDAAQRALHGNPNGSKPEYAWSVPQALDTINEDHPDGQELRQIKREELDAAVAAIQDAYYRRGNYQYVVDIRDYTLPRGEKRTLPGGVQLRINRDFGFAVGNKKPEMWFSSEGLQKLFEMTRASGLTIAAREAAAESWRINHTGNIVGVRSPHWLNKQEAMTLLDTHAGNKTERADAFNKAWKALQEAARTELKSTASKRIKRTENIISTGGNIVVNMKGEDIFCGYKRDKIAMSAPGNAQFSIQEDSLPALQRQMGEGAALPKKGGKKKEL